MTNWYLVAAMLIVTASQIMLVISMKRQEKQRERHRKRMEEFEERLEKFRNPK